MSYSADSLVNDLSAAGIDTSLLQRIDVSDLEGVDKFLYSLEEDFQKSDLNCRNISVSNIKTKLSYWADQQANHERKEIHNRISEFIKRLEATKEQTTAPKPNIHVVFEEFSSKNEPKKSQYSEAKREDTEDEEFSVGDASQQDKECTLPLKVEDELSENEILEIPKPKDLNDFSGSADSTEDNIDNDNEIIEHSIEVPLLDEYEEIVEKEQAKTETCEICYEDRSSQEMYTLTCRHRYCRQCLQDHITVRINSGWLISIPCLHPACSESIPDSDVCLLTSPEEYQKFKRFQELAELNSNPTCRWCPKPDCNTAVIADPSEENFPCIVCTKCETKFCFECSAEWHPNLTCRENERRTKTSKDKKSDKWRKNHKIRKCAQCGMDIQKDSGCNHMKCTRCGYEFCWICMTQFVPDHYINGPCAGLQFTAHPILKRRLKKLKRAVIGAVIVLVAIPIVLIIAGIALVVIIITVPIYLAYRLIKFLKQKWSNRKTSKRKSKPVHIPPPPLSDEEMQIRNVPEDLF